MVLTIAESAGVKHPAVVTEALRDVADDILWLDRCGALRLTFFGSMHPKDLVTRWYGAGIRLAESKEFWNPDDYPLLLRHGLSTERGPVTEGLDSEPNEPKGTFYGMTYRREGLLLSYAEALRKYGYVLYVNPGKRCETMCIGLTTWRGEPDCPWLGDGCVKTQYAHKLKRAHTSVVTIIDLLQEEGLLERAKDDSGFFKHRDWDRAQRKIAVELGGAGMMASLFTGTPQLAAASDVDAYDPESDEEASAAMTAFNRLRDLGITPAEAMGAANDPEDREDDLDEADDD
jgi:hypothetical protein